MAEGLVTWGRNKGGRLSALFVFLTKDASFNGSGPCGTAIEYRPGAPAFTYDIHAGSFNVTAESAVANGTGVRLTLPREPDGCAQRFVDAVPATLREGVTEAATGEIDAFIRQFYDQQLRYSNGKAVDAFLASLPVSS